MAARGGSGGARQFLADYQQTWSSTGPAGQRFLLGGLFYLIRGLGFSVAFPLFAKARGYDTAEIGLFLAASQFSLFLLGVPITFLGGRGYARRTLIFAPILAAIGLIVIIAAPRDAGAITLIGAFLAGAGGASFWVLGDPLLASTTPASQRANIFALKFFLVTIGVSLGGGLGGWIPGLLENVGGMPATSALASTLAVFACLDIVQSFLFGRIPPYETPPPPRVREPRSARVKTKRSAGWWIPWAVMLALAAPELGMALGHNSIRPFLSLFFTEEYDLGAAATGTILAILGLLGGIGALATPRIAARFGNIGAIVFLRITASACILLWFAGLGFPAVLALMVLYYLLMDGTEAIFITEGMSRLPAARRTWFSGIYAMTWSLSASTASILSGVVQDRNDGRFGAAFAIGAAGYTFSVVWMWLVFPRLPRLVEQVEPVPVPEPLAG